MASATADRETEHVARDPQNMENGLLVVSQRDHPDQSQGGSLSPDEGPPSLEPISTALLHGPVAMENGTRSEPRAPGWNPRIPGGRK